MVAILRLDGPANGLRLNVQVPRSLPLLRHVRAAPRSATIAKLAISTPVEYAAHGCGCGVEQDGEDADQRDGDEGLHERGSKAQREAFRERALVRHQIGGDHALAVAGPGRVENSIRKANREQRPDRAPVLLHRGRAPAAGSCRSRSGPPEYTRRYRRRAPPRANPCRTGCAREARRWAQATRRSSVIAGRNHRYREEASEQARCHAEQGPSRTRPSLTDMRRWLCWRIGFRNWTQRSASRKTIPTWIAVWLGCRIFGRVMLVAQPCGAPASCHRVIALGEPERDEEGRDRRSRATGSLLARGGLERAESSAEVTPPRHHGPSGSRAGAPNSCFLPLALSTVK